MADRKIAIDAASEAQLRQYADVSLGIKVAAHAKTATIIAAIRRAQPTIAEIEIEEDDTPEQDITLRQGDDADEEIGQERARTIATGRGTKGTSSKDDPIVKLLIPEEEKPGGKRAHYVSVNGNGMLIPRARIVDVPYRFYEVMRNGVKSVYEMDAETKKLVEHKVPHIPIQVYEMPPRAAVRAWIERIAEDERKAAAEKKVA